MRRLLFSALVLGMMLGASELLFHKDLTAEYVPIFPNGVKVAEYVPIFPSPSYPTT